MSLMIERMAQSICKSRTCEGISCCQWPAQGGRVDCPVKRGAYDDAAKCAIETMLNPTVAMIAAGWVGLRGKRVGPVFTSPGPGLVEGYRSMIDEALK